jgi:hypothetical protein
MSARISSRRRDRRRRTALRAALVAGVLLVTGGAVYAGLARDESTPTAGATRSASASASPSPTPLSSLDLSGLPIARAPFCDVLDRGDVEEALGSPVAATAHYDSGDRVRITAGVTDVAHEFDCTFSAADGTQARAWVFAEPVTARVAGALAAESLREPGCAPATGTPTFGTPGAATLCRTGRPVTSTVTLRGLFGDAWLTCRLQAPAPVTAPATAQGTVERAAQWCVRVATTLGARR